MIIFGWGHRRERNFGIVGRHRCGNCSNEANWALQSISFWFTLFFIPIFPYKIHYLLVCPVCRSGYEVGREEFEDLKRKITEGRIDNSSASSNSGFETSGKTETQINYLKAIQEYEREMKNKMSSHE